MRILIVGTLKGYVTSAAKIAIQRGAKVSHCETIHEALEELRKGNGADVALIDLNLNIKLFIDSLQSERISLPVIACGIAQNPAQAVKAIEDGASDYLPLPPNPELIAAIFEFSTKEEKPLIWQDDKMKPIMQIADKIAPSEATVLITGESGTGKEVMAQYIHKKSKRAKNPFISLNCAAIPENLLESELFGHEKGAFTGAIAKRIGKFEEANGGTLFLDEISEMPLHLQAKLLRAIQERVIDRIGGTTPIKVNIRIITTSNRNLKEAINIKEFREDLYFRLNVVNIHLPPLRERMADIPLLANFFIQKYAKINGISPKPFTKEAEAFLKKGKWEGNVRELENSIHRALILAQGESIETEDIQLDSNTSQGVNQESTLVGQTMAEMEKKLILNTLDHCSGNRTHAAAILGISIRTLRNKLKEYSENHKLAG